MESYPFKYISCYYLSNIFLHFISPKTYHHPLFSGIFAFFTKLPHAIDTNIFVSLTSPILLGFKANVQKNTWEISNLKSIFLIVPFRTTL